MIHPSPPPAANPSVAPHLFLHLLIFFSVFPTNLVPSSRRAGAPARPLRPSSPSLLGFDLCVIDAVNYPISRLTGGAVTIRGIEVFPLHPFPLSLHPSISSSHFFLRSSHFLLSSLHQPPPPPPCDHLLFVGGEVMHLRQKWRSGQVVVWVFLCTKLLGRRRGSRKVD